MTVKGLVASVTGEHWLVKHTGRRDRPSREEIARLAYHFFEIRGKQHGRDVDDWLAAEEELLRHYQ